MGHLDPPGGSQSDRTALFYSRPARGRTGRPHGCRASVGEPVAAMAARGLGARDYPLCSNIVAGTVAGLDWTASPVGVECFNWGVSRPVRFTGLVAIVRWALVL